MLVAVYPACGCRLSRATDCRLSRASVRDYRGSPGKAHRAAPGTRLNRQRQLRALGNRPARIQLRRHVAAADLMHRFPCLAQRFRQIAARLLTGADNHMIHRQQLAFAADSHM